MSRTSVEHVVNMEATSSLSPSGFLLRMMGDYLLLMVVEVVS